MKPFGQSRHEFPGLCSVSLQLRTAPGTGRAVSAWSSRAAAGAPTPATRAKASASRARIAGPSRPPSRPRPPCPACLPALSRRSILACVPARPNTTGPSSTVQVGRNAPVVSFLPGVNIICHTHITHRHSTASCPGLTCFFIHCLAACQCNGHSQCVNESVCEKCEDLTTGRHCESCISGFYGDPTNGGSCQREYPPGRRR